MISTCRAHKGTVNARLSRQTRKQQSSRTVFPTFFSLAREMRRREFLAGVHDANARAGNDIGTNSSNAKTRKAFTREDVSKRLKRLREDLTRANTTRERPQVRAKQPSGLGFRRYIKANSSFFSHRILEFASFVSLVSLWVRADID